ncbi:hypothetical protein YOLOSWAG_309 [Erwinia phage vB_EamM_Yoloswag]|uniref:Uncharacterized protein n=1 Tax=Erwinia phage vB_EamM_Yoloswag TaxID=1958956 RepID=A0A1S6L3Q0_9CAUD|nr:hypothetical protein HOR66_gp309 [Erwinia phage vB_EamM_Yoloswag]AQT28779.1 hypothetical protein YOLOSWAG_309 [Erwinia phage vB_EamM_Yoloswag]
MKTVNELVKQLKQSNSIVLTESVADSVLPDLKFTLDVLCMNYRLRQIDTLSGGRQTKIELRS